MKIKEKKNKTAISLIVLVITILVLSILAATVIITISNTNVIEEANKVTFKSDMSNYKEVFEMYVTRQTMKNKSFDSTTLDGTYATKPDTFKDIFGEIPEKYQEGLRIQDGKLVYETEDETKKAIAKDLGMSLIVIEPPENAISKTETTEGGKSPYIGCYVKIGDEYGVIFADLAIGGSGTWGNESFSYKAVENKDTLKDYVVTEEIKNSGFGENYVLEVAGDTTGKIDRFYVMALDDINDGEYYCWYFNAGWNISDKTVVSSDFGTGKANTNTMITKWNGSEYGVQSATDMLGVIQDKVYGNKEKIFENVEWYVPSRAEWGVFCMAFGLTKSSYTSFGLSGYYWSSSLSNDSESQAWPCTADIGSGIISSDVPGVCDYSVRLAATF